MSASYTIPEWCAKRRTSRSNFYNMIKAGRGRAGASSPKKTTRPGSASARLRSRLSRYGSTVTTITRRVLTLRSERLPVCDCEGAPERAQGRQIADHDPAVIAVAGWFIASPPIGPNPGNMTWGNCRRASAKDLVLRSSGGLRLAPTRR